MGLIVFHIVNKNMILGSLLFHDNYWPDIYIYISLDDFRLVILKLWESRPYLLSI